MWITTTIITKNDYREGGEEIQLAHFNKKIELQKADGNGLSFSPWTHQEQADGFSWTATIKRRWNTLECATEYVNWTNENTSGFVTTIEEVTP